MSKIEDILARMPKEDFGLVRVEYTDLERLIRTAKAALDFVDNGDHARDCPVYEWDAKGEARHKCECGFLYLRRSVVDPW